MRPREGAEKAKRALPPPEGRRPVIPPPRRPHVATTGAARVAARGAPLRGGEGQAGLAAARGAHVGHLALPLRHLLDDGAGMLVVDVDDDGFVRLLAGAAGTVAEQHPRAADRELE